MVRRGFGSKLLKAVSAVCIFAFVTPEAFAYNIRITCRAKGIELDLFKKAIDLWIESTGNQHKVEVVTLPHSSNECFALYKQWFSAESFDVDILMMDCSWIAAFANVMADLNKFISENDINKDDIFPSILNNMYDRDRLVALPAYADCQIMYYRKDLLEKYNKPVPKTWRELYETAKFIQEQERRSNNRFYGFVFQAKAFEMLTCNFVQMADAFGGTIVSDGKVTVNSEACVNALVFMMKCLKDISTRSVLNYSEEETRGMFQAGNALFMNNWPYAWSLMNGTGTAISNKFDVMPIPAAEANIGKQSGSLGGWFFAVSRYSKHVEVAASLVKFLTSKEQHKKRAMSAYAPAYKSLYADQELQRQNPCLSVLCTALDKAAIRPSKEFGRNYSRATAEIFNLVNTALTESLETVDNESTAQKYLNRLDKRLDDILQKTARATKSTEDSKISKQQEESGGIWNWFKSLFK